MKTTDKVNFGPSYFKDFRWNEYNRLMSSGNPVEAEFIKLEIQKYWGVQGDQSRKRPRTK